MRAELLLVDPIGDTHSFTLAAGVVVAGIALRETGRWTFVSQRANPRNNYLGYVLVDPVAVAIVDGSQEDEWDPGKQFKVDIRCTPQRALEGEDVTIAVTVLQDDGRTTDTTAQPSVTLQELHQRDPVSVSVPLTAGVGSTVVQRRAGTLRYYITNSRYEVVVPATAEYLVSKDAAADPGEVSKAARR